MYPLLRRAADVALRALTSALDERPPFVLVSWVASQLGGEDPLQRRVRDLLKQELRCEASPTFVGTGDLAEDLWSASELAAPLQSPAGRRRAWWTDWLSARLDRTYATAVGQLRSECPLGVYFCATENHTIAADWDMHLALEEDVLYLLALGTQFDLYRPARIAAYHAPAPVTGGGHGLAQALLADGVDSLPLPPTVEEWQLVRPIPDQCLAAARWFGRRQRRDPSVPARALLPSHPRNYCLPRAQIRGGVLRANPARLRIDHLVLQLDIGQPRPLQFTIFGLREMWASVLILRRWLGDALQADVAWNDQAWRFDRFS